MTMPCLCLCGRLPRRTKVLLAMTMMWILHLRLRMTVERRACDDDEGFVFNVMDSSPSAQNDGGEEGL